MGFSGTPSNGRQQADDGRDTPESEDAYARGASQADGTPVDAPADASSDDASAATAPEVGDPLEQQRDKYLRLAAEYDNYRKRVVRERQDAASRAQAELAKALVDSLDDLARVAHVNPASTDVRTIQHGVELVERKLLKALTAAGLQVINPVDQPFDPARHEAVSTEHALSPEDDHMVARVYQPGYLFNGQLLRPARVAVKQWNG